MSQTAQARVQIVKWGNSQAVRLPKAVLKQANVQQGDELTVRVEGHRISLEPAAPEITLDSLIASITSQNRHSELDWGRPVGNEVW
jgi:antitoxin MazE